MEFAQRLLVRETAHTHAHTYAHVEQWAPPSLQRGSWYVGQCARSVLTFEPDTGVSPVCMLWKTDMNMGMVLAQGLLVRVIKHRLLHCACVCIAVPCVAMCVQDDTNQVLQWAGEEPIRGFDMQITRTQWHWPRDSRSQTTTQVWHQVSVLVHTHTHTQSHTHYTHIEDRTRNTIRISSMRGLFTS